MTMPVERDLFKFVRLAKTLCLVVATAKRLEDCNPLAPGAGVAVFHRLV
jgi:hypothetical protein